MRTRPPNLEFYSATQGFGPSGHNRNRSGGPTEIHQQQPGSSKSKLGTNTILVIVEILFVVTLLLIWVLSEKVRASLSLWVFFLYSFPAEFLVAVVPHEVPLLHLANRYDPLILALVAGTGTLATEVLNYHVLSRLLRGGTTRSPPGKPGMHHLEGTFGRAPFLALWIAGATPVLPFFPLRFLAVARGYPRWRYLLAGATSRTPRFYVTALIGKTFHVPTPVLICLFAILIASIAPASITRWRSLGRSSV